MKKATVSFILMKSDWCISAYIVFLLTYGVVIQLPEAQADKQTSESGSRARGKPSSNT
jgi:hypothetical protein